MIQGSGIPRTARTQFQDMATQALLPSPSWEEQARQAQQNYLELLGTCMYDSYRRKIPSICNLLLNGFCKCHEDDGVCANESEMMALRMKIGFALCGQPSKKSSEENGCMGYPEDKLKWISEVFNQIVNRQQSDKVLMSIIFISLETDDGTGNVTNFPVFRIPKPGKDEECCFVDPSGRLYKNWKDFLSNNKLYKSKCCYPKDGIYSGDAEGKVEIGYGLTPASTLTEKVIGGVDKAACIGAFAAGVCTFIPPIALPSAAACGVVSVYSSIRTAIELADRGNHGQSLKNREAARHWLSLAGTVFGLGSAGGTAVVRMMAREGKAVSNVVSGLITGLSFSSTAVNGISIVDNALTIHEQDEWLSSQSAQLVLSVLFFTHSLTNFKTARSVIVETQNQVLDAHSAGLSKRQRNLFNSMQRETLNGEPDPVIGRAKIIRDLSRISNKSEFFGSILRSNKEARKNDQPVQKFKFGGLLDSHDGLVDQGHTSSPQNVFLRQTTGFTAPPKGTPYFLNAAPRYVQPHEPALVTQIRVHVQDILCSNMNVLLRTLDEVCSKFKYGRLCMSAIRIVFDICNCDNNVQEAMHILKNVINLWNDLVAEIKAQRDQSRQSEHESHSENDENSNNDSETEQTDVEEIMNEIAEDVDFIPEHFYLLGNVEIEEEVYHFPVDHQYWDENGLLVPEDYVLIAQNAFGSYTQACNIVHQGNTVNVYLEHYGLVKITSSVQEQIIILKKFKKQE